MLSGTLLPHVQTTWASILYADEYELHSSMLTWLFQVSFSILDLCS